MDVMEAIRTRRSISRMRPDPVPRATVERLLQAAVLAPNHYQTAPWRFIVLTGEARDRLGAAQEAALRRMLPDPDAPTALPDLAKERRKPRRSPVVIVAAAEPDSGPKIQRIEEIAATAAAVQNLLLAAQAEGLAAIWRTGATAYSPEVREALGLGEHAQVLGIIYLGYPDVAQMPGPRPPRTPPATWLGWDTVEPDRTGADPA
jgi:nitroreductase